MNDLKPCPFCGSNKTLTVRVRQCDRNGWEQGWEPSITCMCGIDFGIGFFGGGCDPDDIEDAIIDAWNTRYNRDKYPSIMVIGDDHDRLPLIEAIKQIGFDGIIIAEEKQPEPFTFELPVRTTHGKIVRESNADRCGYSTKRK